MTDNVELAVKPPFRWSFSQWEAYNQCPAKWNFQSRMKLPRRPPGPAAARGLQMHDTVEQYIKGGEPSVLHPDIDKKYIPILDAYRNHPNGDRYTEKKLAFDAEWYLCAPQSKYAACVAVLDAVRYSKPRHTDVGVLEVGEWKSGKPKDTHGDQRKLYAMFGMRAWLADEVRVTTYYLEDTAPPQRLVVSSQSGFEKLKALWIDRISTMQRDQICAPRPGFYCRFCDYAKSQGGPCQFGA
jgi:hypothetical protein